MPETITPTIIAISGGSCSGKTTLCHWLQQTLGDDNCLLVYQDDYYRGLKTITNFDVPEAIEFELLAQHIEELKQGNTVDIPCYDFTTHRRKHITKPTKPKPIIIVDGILILHAQELKSRFHLSVFVECSEAERRERRLNRDVKERGRNYQDTLQQFNQQTVPMHDKFVEPSKQNADLIIKDNHDWPQLIEFCKRQLS